MEFYPSSFYPTSSCRDEPYVPSETRHDPLGLLSPEPSPLIPPLSISYPQYVFPPRTELFPGLMSDNTLTEKHPFVDLYLANVPYVSPADGRKPPVEAWWKKGVREQTVSQVLDLDVGKELNELQSECVFVLAALKVFYHPRHLAHFTFWGTEAKNKTAERVHKLINMQPCPIASPVAWYGIADSLWLVNGMQCLYFPPERQGKRADNGMLLRKRKGGRESVKEKQAAAEDTVERPRKRTRMSKGDDTQPATEETAEVSTLDPLPLPEVATLDVEAKLEIMNDSEEAAAVEPARRSTRQTRRVATSSTPSPSPLSAPSSIPDASPEQEDLRQMLTRKRSTSTSGSSTAVSVSDGGSSSAETAVEEKASAPAGAKATGKRKRVDKEDEKADEAKGGKLESEERQVRTSTRVRKPAQKKAVVEEEAKEKESAPTKKSAAKKATVAPASMGVEGLAAAKKNTGAVTTKATPVTYAKKPRSTRRS